MNLDDTLLMSYVDGDAPPEARADIERAIASSPEVAARLGALRASMRLPYAAAFGQQALPPVPAALIQQFAGRRDAAQLGAAQAAAPGVGEVPRAARRGRFVPWLAVAFLAGALMCGAVFELVPGIVPGAAPVLPWVRVVAGYQELYVRDTVSGIGGDPGTASQLLQQIHQTDGMALRVPDLSSAGLTFKRMQRLRFRDKPLVQIVYLPEAGEPIALCVIKDAQPDRALHTQQVDGMEVVTWRRDKLSYALLGKGPQVDLEALGQRISNNRIEALFNAAPGRPAT